MDSNVMNSQMVTMNRPKKTTTRLALIGGLLAAVLLLGWRGWALALEMETAAPPHASPAVTTNVCSLPGARIDAGDTAYEGHDILVSGCQGEINGAHAFNSLTVQTGSTLVHSPTLTMSLTIHTNALIESGAAIDLTSRGYAGGAAYFNPGEGPGGGQPADGTGGGGGHGGYGGALAAVFASAGVAYGDPYRPALPGSGGAGCSSNSFCGSPGGDGGDGGGAVHLDVAGTLTVDGRILANGENAIALSGTIPGAGGAGGSIWLQAAAFAGGGQLMAEGGSGAGVRKIGGGGGRIAVYYASSTFSGSMSAQGGQTELSSGTSYDNAASAGTIYLRDIAAAAGHLIVANRPLLNAILPPAATTPLDGGLVTPSEPHNFTYFDLSGPALVSTRRPVTVALGSTAHPGLWAIHGRFDGVTTTLGSGVSLSVTAGTTATVGLQRTAFDGRLTMDPAADLRIDQNTWVELRAPLALNAVWIGGGSRLGHVAYRPGISPTLHLTATAVTIEAGSQINVGGRGFRGATAGPCGVPGEGPGGGLSGSLIGAGGGYGGAGGGQNNQGGFTYGSAAAPADLGSGGSAGCGGGGSTLGNGAAGGGRVRLAVSGSLTVEGGIYARGGAAVQAVSRPGGGGAGGAIWIAAETLAGSGVIDAKGGDSGAPGLPDFRGGGGGGGRIALYVANLTFAGTLNAAGGLSGNGTYPHGGAGTIIPDDLFIASKSANPAVVVAGQPLTYTLRVGNYSTATITAHITDTLPNAVTPGGVRTWTAVIPAGGAWTQLITVTVSGGASGSLTNRLDVTANGVTRQFVLQTPLQDAPIAGLSAGNSGPTVQSVPTTLSAAVASGSGVQYSWDLGDGATAGGASVSHVYAVSGTYTATVTAVNSVSSAVTHTVVTILPRPAFAGVAWLDADGDGAVGPGEAGLDGVSITAVSGAGSGSTTSANGGAWRLDGLPAGIYALSASLPGHDPTTPNPATLSLPTAGSAQVPFGFRAALPPGAGQIAGRLFNDQDGDGLPAPAEATFAGQTITLLQNGAVLNTTATDASGYYAFASLAPGTYAVRGTAPGGYYPNPAQRLDVVVSGGSQTTAHLPVGLGGTLGGAVAEVGGAGVAGATLMLAQNGSVLQTTATAADGSYAFGPLPPGDYDLSLALPAGLLPIDGITTRSVAVANNAASIENWTLSRLGRLRVQVYDFVYNVGNVPIGGVAVTATNGISTLLGSTDYNGDVLWRDLPPGQYTVTPDPATLPAGATVSPAARTVAVANDTSALASFSVSNDRIILAYCATGGTLRYANFPCTVAAYDAAGALVDSASSPAGGLVTLPNLPVGSYQVRIEPADAGWPVHAEMVVVASSTVATLYYPFNPVAADAIAGHAFRDTQPPVGVRTPGTESGSADANGLAVTLLDAGGAVLTTTITAPANGATGYFRFDNLAAGDYEVRISLPAGSGPTTPTSVWRTVDLQQAPSAVEFGYQRNQNGSVNGRVFFDNDADGAFHPNADDGRGGAIVALRDPSGALQATTTTAPDGQFQFSGLISGEYVLHLAVSGSPTTLDRPVSLPFNAPYASVSYALPPTDGRQRIVVFLDENGNQAPDAGEQRFGGLTVQRDDVLCGGSFTVSDDAVTNSSGVALFSAPLGTFGCTRVRPGDMPAGTVPHDPYGIVLATTAGVLWLPLEPAGTLLVQPYWDADGNGLRGSGEPLLSGIQASVGGTQATSGAAGATFSLGGSTHSVSVQPPGNMLVGVAQPLVVSVIGGQSLALPVPLRYTGSIAGSVQASGGAATWGSLTVLLEQLDGAYIAQQVVPAGAPTYSFAQAPPGTYRLRLASVPPGWALQTQPVFAYPAGSTVGQNLTLVKLGSAGGHVYLDKNGNGQRNSSDPATSAYGVTLLNNAGQALLNVTPAADGSFSFPNLTPGVLYAVTANLGNGIGAPNASVTQWSGWFSVDSSGVDVTIGVFPYAWPDDQFNVVYGTVTAGGVPVGGAEVGYYLWKDGEGCDNPSGIQRRTRTDGNGRYQLQTIVLPFDLFDGPYYCVQVLDAPGYTPTNAAVVVSSYTYSSSGGQLVVLSTIDQQHLTLDVGTRRQAASDVSWAAFRDDNGSGAWEAGEPALPGGVLRSGAISGTTGLDGRGALAGLGAGRHDLALTPPPGYAPAWDGGALTRTVWLSGTGVALPPLGFRPAGALLGSAFVDNDGDGRQAADEAGLGGVAVTLSGPVVTTTLTQPDGTFVLFGLPDGVYAVTAVAPAGFAPLAAQSVTLAGGGVLRLPARGVGLVSGAAYADWDGDGVRAADEPLLRTPLTVTLSSGGAASLTAGRFLFWSVAGGVVDVAAQADSVLPARVDPAVGGGVLLPEVGPGQVRGAAWHDANGDGVRQPWEAPLSGVVVTVGGRTGVTGEDGRFHLLLVPAGTHAVTAQLPEGLEAALPAVTVSGQRGAVVGVAAVEAVEVVAFGVFLPVAKRP